MVRTTAAPLLIRCSRRIADYEVSERLTMRLLMLTNFGIVKSVNKDHAAFKDSFLSSQRKPGCSMCEIGRRLIFGSGLFDNCC